MRLLISGPPGTGKGTQAKLLAKKYKLKHISTGKLLRNEIKQKTRRARKIAKIINNGNFVPDRMVMRIVKEKTKNQNNFILDGSPRDVNQARKIKNLDYVIWINSSKNNIIKRLLKRKRKDDIKETINHRFEIYNKKTKPLKEFYKKKKVKIININGDQTIKQVHNKIMRKLKDAKIQVHR